MRAKQIRFKVFSVLLVVILLIGTIPISVCASETISDFEYSILDDGTIEITKYTGNSKYVTIPEIIDGYEVIKINRTCFLWNDTIQNIYISKTVKSIVDINCEPQAFNTISSLCSITVDSENTQFASIDGVLFRKELDKLLYYPISKKDETYSVPEFVTSIVSYAFASNPYLKCLNFNSEFEYIGNRAIFGCCIEEINYPIYDKPSEEIVLFAFCQTLKKVFISKDIHWINEGDFYGSNPTLYVYDNSYGLEWAKNHSFPYEIIIDEPEYIYGDVNLDGEVSVTDATAIQKLIIGLDVPEEQTELINTLADVNNDGVVSILDATCIQKYLVGYSDNYRTGELLETQNS